jgi:2-phospho-L-lactate guanylyltransferase
MPLVAVIPLKEAPRAKTRLSADEAARAALAAAFARDVVAACRGCSLVTDLVVVGASPVGGPAAMPDPGLGLNAALGAAARAAPPDAMVMALMGDLPCIGPDDLALVVESTLGVVAGGARGAFVPDAAGTGTTCLCAPRSGFEPQFGEHSRARHAAAGYVELADPRLKRVRRDVDSPADLADALLVGVGEFSAAALDPPAPAAFDRPRH